MTYNKSQMLAKAIEVAKEYARGGNTTTPDHIIDLVYKKLVELNATIESK